MKLDVVRGTARAIVLGAWEVVAKRTARAYVAGPTLDDAHRVSRWLSDRKTSTTIGFWDEPGAPPLEVMKEYLAGIDAIAAGGLDSYLSIKLPSLRYDWTLLAKVLDRALEKRVRVHFDALAPDTADESLAMIERASRSYPGLGCTLPSRWARSAADAELAARSRLGVRVVKGQWADPTAPDLDARAHFLSLVERLAGRVPRVAVATHDVPLLRASLERLVAAGTPVEVELLLGLPVRPAVRVAIELGVPARLYVPYGDAYLPYTLSQARRQPRVLWWIARDTVLGRTLLIPRHMRHMGLQQARGRAAGTG